MLKVNLLFLTVVLIFVYPVKAQDENCLAAGCHDTFLKKEVIHPAIEEDCLSCHESNGEKHPDSTGTQFTLIAEIPELCYNCHDQKDNLTYVHEPVKEGGCLDCHSPHSSDKEGLIIGDEDESICLSCHELEEGKTIHAPYEGQECTYCHTPHHSLRQGLLTAEVPDLCFDCHEDLGELTSLTSVHPPFEEECLSCHQPHVARFSSLLIKKSPMLCLDCHEADEETNPAHATHGSFKESEPCLTCHTPHASEQEAVLRKETPDLCFECHHKGRTNTPDMEMHLKRATVIHAPVEDEGCLGCHLLHDESYPHLLIAAFPATDYTESTPDSFALCFECHDASILEPNNLDTGFRNGRTNLHALHISGDKGRSCTLCHDAHGAQSEHLIPRTVRFGKWDMPLNYKVLPNGGSCAPGCHEEKAYRNSD